MGSVRVPVFRKADRAIIAWTLVDESEAEKVLWYRWTLNADGYVVAGKNKYLHRMILAGELRKGLVTDHVNGDKLDNRRRNLRAVPVRVNSRNSAGRTTWRGRAASSAFRGVSWRTTKGKWLAHARLNNKQHHLGLYDDELEAARAVDRFWDEQLGTDRVRNLAL